MAKKTTTSFNIDKAISRISRPSVFDYIVKEVEAKEIPIKYIEQILVQFYDGNVIELKGNEITHPIPLNKDISWDSMQDSFKRIRDVKIFVNTELLETDINDMIEEIIGEFC